MMQASGHTPVCLPGVQLLLAVSRCRLGLTSSVFAQEPDGCTMRIFGAVTCVCYPRTVLGLWGSEATPVTSFVSVALVHIDITNNFTNELTV
jgi:hypothetical protein